MSKRKKKRWTKTDVKKKGKGSATEPPMCKLCGTRHWNREPHNYKTKKSTDGIHQDNIKVVK